MIYVLNESKLTYKDLFELCRLEHPPRNKTKTSYHVYWWYDVLINEFKLNSLN